MIHYSENIALPIEQVWKHFLHKIDQPEKFIPGISNVIIKERTADYVIRQMDITSPDGITNTVLEKIIATPYKVSFIILEHPVFTGFVDNLAEVISTSETKITYSMNWVNKNTNEAFSNSVMIQNAVKKSIEFMKSNEQK